MYIYRTHIQQTYCVQTSLNQHICSFNPNLFLIMSVQGLNLTDRVEHAKSTPLPLPNKPSIPSLNITARASPHRIFIKHMDLYSTYIQLPHSSQDPLFFGLPRVKTFFFPFMISSTKPKSRIDASVPGGVYLMNKMAAKPQKPISIKDKHP